MSSSMRKIAKTVARLVRVTEGQTRAQQLRRSVVVSGENAATVSDLLAGAAETAAITEEQSGDIARLDEADILAGDLLADAGDYTDLIGLEDAMSDQTQEASDQFEQSVELDEATHVAHMTAIGANLVVSEAQAAAEEASELALEAKITADGRNRIYAQALNPVASPEFPFVSGDLWYRTETVSGVTRFVEVFMWNGAEWKPYQMVASSLLVPGTVGPTLIENGAITTGKLAATAIDGMTVTGATIRTAASGQRLQLNEYGLLAFGPSGIETARMSSAGGGFKLSGDIWMQDGDVELPRTVVQKAALTTESGTMLDGYASTSAQMYQGQVTTQRRVAKLGSSGGEGAARTAAQAADTYSLVETSFRPPTTSGWGAETRTELETTATYARLSLVGVGGSGSITAVSNTLTFEAQKFVFTAPVQFQGDTDWANATLLSGITGSATWRRRLGTIELFFDCNTASIAPNGSVNLFTLPSSALEGLPAGGVASLAVVVGGSGSGTGLIGQASGTCAVRNLHTSAVNRFRGNASWPAT